MMKFSLNSIKPLVQPLLALLIYFLWQGDRNVPVAGHWAPERKLGSDEVIEFEVSGDNIQCIHMLPGYTHTRIYP